MTISLKSFRLVLRTLAFRLLEPSALVAGSRRATPPVLRRLRSTPSLTWGMSRLLKFVTTMSTPALTLLLRLPKIISRRLLLRQSRTSVHQSVPLATPPNPWTFLRVSGELAFHHQPDLLHGHGVIWVSCILHRGIKTALSDLSQHIYRCDII